MYEPKCNTDFVPPINDFSERYDEASVDAHSNPREVICGVITALVFAPLGYIAFCAVLVLGDVF
ncbi:MAG: hypothetical protein SPF41_06665 [Candidatus Merdousia sp.]|nr:hypothetical protein [Candidatus Merdousia sp.]